MDKRYVRLVHGGLRAIDTIGRWTAVCVIGAIGAVAGITASLVIGGMGLALMGTAVGIGPIGWIAIMVVVGLAIYGGVCLLRRK